MPKKTEEYRCPDCDAPPFTRPHGLSRHRSQQHGVVSPTAARRVKADPKALRSTTRSRARSSAPAPKAPGRFAAAIAELEREAGDLEGKAKVARDAAATLRQLA
jgi:hypothetical protein